jgi:hypothetical protein
MGCPLAWHIHQDIGTKKEIMFNIKTLIQRHTNTTVTMDIIGAKQFNYMKNYAITEEVEMNTEPVFGEKFLRKLIGFEEWAMNNKIRFLQKQQLINQNYGTIKNITQ